MQNNMRGASGFDKMCTREAFFSPLLCLFFLFEGLKRGVCSQINHFPDDADYDQDAAEYLLREYQTHEGCADIRSWFTGEGRDTLNSTGVHTVASITLKDTRRRWADINSWLSNSSKTLVNMRLCECSGA